MQSLNSALARQAFLAPIVLRLVLGALLFYHGFDKFSGGIGGVEGFFDANGVPAPALTAPLVAAIEIIVGLALIVGVGTRIAAAVQIAVLIGAMAFVKLPDILGSSELDLAYIAGLAAIVVLGPGRLSVDEALGADDTVIDLRNRSEARPMVNA